MKTPLLSPKLFFSAAVLLSLIPGQPLWAQQGGAARTDTRAPAAEPQSAGQMVVSPPEIVPALPVPRLIKFSGVVKDPSGDPRTGVVGLTFSIYKDQEGGSTLWMETHNMTLDEQGHYGVLLGSEKSEGVPLELFASGEPRWLGVKLELAGEVEQARVLLVSVPYALKAADADTLGGKPASAYLTLERPGGANGPTPQSITSISQGTGIIANPNPIIASGTIAIDTTVVPQLGAANVFAANQTVSGTLTATSFSGNGLNVTNVNAAMLSGMAASAFAQLGAANNAFSGGITLGGTLTLPNTNSAGTAGIITLGATPFLHNFGSNNTFVGALAGNLSMTGNFNAAFGSQALQANTSGTQNAAFGPQALQKNTTGGGNSAFGFSALQETTTGGADSAFGVEALELNTTGSQNSAYGASALFSNSTGSFNSAFGVNSLTSNTTGTENSAFGVQALQAQTTGNFNDAFGNFALQENTTGGSNSALGHESLLFNTTGSNNTAVGFLAGAQCVPFPLCPSGGTSNITGSNNTFIGANSRPGVSTEVDNATAIGANALVNCSNCIVLGDSTQPMNVGIGTNSPAEPLTVNGIIQSTNGGFMFPDGSSQTTASAGGTITGVSAGTGLVGGGNGGSVGLSINTSVVPTLTANSNSFSGTIKANGFSGDGSALTGVNAGLLGGVNPANFAQLNVANFFSANQTVNATLAASSFTGNGAGLSNVNAFTLNGMSNSSFALLGANSNAFTGSISAASFMGDGTNIANVNANKLGGMLSSAFAPASGSLNYVSKAGDAMTGTLLLPANGLIVGGSQMVILNGNLGIGVSQPQQSLVIAVPPGRAAMNMSNLVDQDLFVTLSQPGAADHVGLIGPGTGTNLGLMVGGDEKVRVTNAGNVGIGIKNPQERLTIAAPAGGSSINVSNLKDQDLQVTLTSPGNADPHALLAPSTPTGLALGVGGAEVIRITEAGNVGIGLTNPPQRLTIAVPSGGFALNASNLVDADFVVNVSPPGAADKTSYVGSKTITSLTLGVGAAEMMRITSTGEVGIGTKLPATALQVLGDIRVGNSGANGCIQNFAGTAISGTCSSDLRLKKDIRPFSRVLEKLAQLQPVTFDWRAEEHPEYHFGPARNSGLIAQEVEQVLPELVSTDSRGFKMVNYSELPYLMLQAIKDLKSENDTLKKLLEAEDNRQQETIARQQSEIRNLAARLAKLEAIAAAKP